MSHLALYRKWRPLSFSDVVGQQHITDTLKNEVKSGKIAHAYLFCGTRGTGKTTTAKILSRAINCNHILSNGDPCNKCESCTGIINGTIMDVSEIDAASNNSVESIRNIRNEVLYTPANISYRVYIIDEAHMLTTAAFNALLKTLEEPPEHIIFILATTEANKIPATVQSRCQRFDFRRISVEDIKNRLLKIAQSDGIKITNEALYKIASLAEGSLRDALSILDQCTTFGEITLEDVESLVGVASENVMMEITTCILNGDAGEALIIVDKMLQKGKDVLSLFDSFLDYFRELLICKSVKEPEKVLAQTPEQASKRAEQAKRFSYEMLIYAIRSLSKTISNAKWASNPRALLEAGLVKLCRPELDDSSDAILARIAKLEQAYCGFKISGTKIERNAENNSDVSIQNDKYLNKQNEKTDGKSKKDSEDILPKTVDNSPEANKNLGEKEQAPVDNSAKSVEKVDKAVDNSKNAEDIIKKIVNERPRLRPNLIGTTFYIQEGALVIIQTKSIAYKYLTNTDNLAFMEQIAGCEVKVLKSMGEIDVKKQDIEDLLAQKEVFGDKMTIINE